MVSISHTEGHRARRLRHDERDWADDIALALAGFSGVIAALQTFASAEVQQRIAIPDVSPAMNIAFNAAGFVIAALLVIARTRALGIMMGAGCSAAVAFLSLVGGRYDLLTIALGLLTVFLIAAKRLDRRRREQRAPSPHAVS